MDFGILKIKWNDIYHVYDPCSSSNHCPAGQVSILGIGFGSGIGAINCAPEKLRAQPHKNISFPAQPQISLPFLIARPTRYTRRIDGGSLCSIVHRRWWGYKRKKKGKKIQRKEIVVKGWKFGVKTRELSRNGRTKEIELVYKAVVLIYLLTPNR